MRRAGEGEGWSRLGRRSSRMSATPTRSASDTRWSRLLRCHLKQNHNVSEIFLGEGSWGEQKWRAEVDGDAGKLPCKR